MTLKQILSCTWELPQNLIGYIISIITGRKVYKKYETATLYTWSRKEGLSLGSFIFVPYREGQEINQELAERFIKHEYGHTLQSKYLGWFYLIVVGLPSLIWNACFKQYRAKHNVDYYDFPVEKWADMLGGVKR